VGCTPMKILFSRLFLVLGIIYSGLLLAEPVNYQIEVVVFLQNWPNTEVSEETSSQIEWPANLSELSTYTKANSLMLTDNVTALAKNSAYQPVFHSGWNQTVEENSASIPVHIQSPDGMINGFVQMQRGRNLHLTVSFEYKSGNTDDTGSNLVYRFNEKRQFQLNDIQYFDHPKFGVITKISPIANQ
jgi:Peptidoglycan-binding protein, CsiV